MRRSASVMKNRTRLKTKDTEPESHTSCSSRTRSSEVCELSRVYSIKSTAAAALKTCQTKAGRYASLFQLQYNFSLLLLCMRHLIVREQLCRQTRRETI